MTDEKTRNTGPEPPKIGTWRLPEWRCNCDTGYINSAWVNTCAYCHTVRPPLPDSLALEVEAARLRERAKKDRELLRMRSRVLNEE